MRKQWIALWTVSLSMVVVGCADEPSVDPTDAGNQQEDARPIGSDASGGGGRCGDGNVDADEECDDGARMGGDGCSATCELECGDGEVSGAELCDTAIPEGQEGACPRACDDGVACTADSISGSDCTAECVHGDITAPASGDQCCPDGANASNDDDCPGECGDGFVTGTEACDTAIAAGSVGACPATCDDGMSCTADSVMNQGTCDAVCVNAPIAAGAADSCCPSGATLATDPDCPVACGDGVRSDGEVCDTAIAAGNAGACPTACEAGGVCTTVMLAGAGTCGATCTSMAITMPIGGDGCCPPGATLANDSDCTATCDDGVVSPGEACDTGIASGPGSCPTSCSDGMACTSDVLTGAGTCAATCSFPSITMPVGGDGCCPPNATIATDSDCPVLCGDGVRSASEACDTAIASGPGACPTSCNDGMVCTADSVANAGTCNAVCSHTNITTPAPGDGCCPPGANIGNDSDCTRRCGDGVITAPEETCDDGNTNAGDGCSPSCVREPRSFRIDTMTLADPPPHAFGIANVTGTVNGLIADGLTMDGDDPPDGLLDFSPVAHFPAYAQTAPTQPGQIVFAECTAPVNTTMCSLGDRPPVDATVTYTGSGNTACLARINGTFVGGASINAPAPPCFVSNEITIALTLGGVPITLRNARVAASYFGSPATELRTGLIRGFLTYADADAAIIPPGTTNVPGVDGEPLRSLLRNQDTDDLDGDGTDDGWWFYLNYTGRLVTYTP